MNDEIEDVIFRRAIDAIRDSCDYTRGQCCSAVRCTIECLYFTVAFAVMIVYLPVSFVLNFCRLLRGIGRSFMKGFRGDRT